MEYLTPSDLKSILHSKRINIFYLEHCRVLVTGGAVSYITEATNKVEYYNIPIANTSVVLLGTGTSITQAAMREFSKAGVLVGFCGGGGTPLYAGCEIEFLNSQSEYRPTEYLQNWIKIWINESKRLEVAKKFQKIRTSNIKNFWFNKNIFNELSKIDKFSLDQDLKEFEIAVDNSIDVTQLLSSEAIISKKLYKYIARATGYGDFKRVKNGEGIDLANNFLDHGNYLAYGLAATACWVLGLPFGLSIVHGKTRRGGLVFDVADLVKDALVMPTCFQCATYGNTEQEFRNKLTSNFYKASALDLIINSVKECCEI